MNDENTESSLFSGAIRNISLQVSDGSVPSEAAAVYKILLLGELFPEAAGENSLFIKEVATRLQRILIMFDVSPHCIEDEAEIPYQHSTRVTEAACFAAVAAYAYGIVKKQTDTGYHAFFSDSERLFTTSIRAGCYLKELLLFDDDFTDANSLCYWAFAELSRLTDCGEWISYCCRFEETVMDEEGCAVTAPLSRQNMSGAAWALFKKGDAEFYRSQIIMEAERLCGIRGSCGCLAAIGYKITDKPEKKDEFLGAAEKMFFSSEYQVNEACI